MIEDAASPVIVTKINLFEVYHKLLKVKDKESAERFTQFVLGRSFVDELDVATLKLAAEEKRTYGLGMADAIVLATAIRHGATLFTGDPDFKRTEHLVETVIL